MAFTLGFHIILVPFGVAFTFIMMIANWRALRRDDADALLLAQRWSKVAAVLFAVGAVSGTVLSFEMGLLWPGLMGRFGAAYGIPFAVEGIFFFLEAIFVAIYIYGWNRLSACVHFWTGLPVVLSGIGRRPAAHPRRCADLRQPVATVRRRARHLPRRHRRRNLRAADAAPTLGRRRAGARALRTRGRRRTRPGGDAVTSTQPTRLTDGAARFVEDRT